MLRKHGRFSLCVYFQHGGAAKFHHISQPERLPFSTMIATAMTMMLAQHYERTHFSKTLRERILFSQIIIISGLLKNTHVEHVKFSRTFFRIFLWEGFAPVLLSECLARQFGAVNQSWPPPATLIGRKIGPLKSGKTAHEL